MNSESQVHDISMLSTQVTVFPLYIMPTYDNKVLKHTVIHINKDNNTCTVKTQSKSNNGNAAPSHFTFKFQNGPVSKRSK